MKITGFYAMALSGSLLVLGGCGKGDARKDLSKHPLVDAGALVAGRMPLKRDGTAYPQLGTELARNSYLIGAETGLTQVDLSSLGSSGSASLPGNLSPDALTSSLGGTEAAVASTSPYSGGVGSSAFGNQSLVLTPFSGSGVATGPAASGGSASDLVGAICDMFEGVLAYFSRCYGSSMGISTETVFSGTSCRTTMSNLVAELGITAAVDPRGIAALSCIGDKLANDVACASSLTADFSTSFFSAFESCGIVVSSTVSSR